VNFGEREIALKTTKIVNNEWRLRKRVHRAFSQKTLNGERRRQKFSMFEAWVFDFENFNFGW